MINLTSEKQECIMEARKVSWLKTKEEIEMYAGALFAAKEWGEKIDSKSKSKNRVKDLAAKYNK